MPVGEHAWIGLGTKIRLKQNLRWWEKQLQNTDATKSHSQFRARYTLVSPLAELQSHS